MIYNGMPLPGKPDRLLGDCNGRGAFTHTAYNDYEIVADNLLSGADRLNRLCELNVIRQVRNVASDLFVQDAWTRGQSLTVHGWVYSLANGLVNDLGVTIGGLEDLARLD